jgi:predicted transcriptional regulator
MAQITINTTVEERNIVLEVLKKIEGKTIPVSKIACTAGLNESKTRYIIMDLIDAGQLRRIKTRAINKHYIRYSYQVVTSSK